MRLNLTMVVAELNWFKLKVRDELDPLMKIGGRNSVQKTMMKSATSPTLIYYSTWLMTLQQGRAQDLAMGI